MKHRDEARRMLGTAKSLYEMVLVAATTLLEFAIVKQFSNGKTPVARRIALAKHLQIWQEQTGRTLVNEFLQPTLISFTGWSDKSVGPLAASGE